MRRQDLAQGLEVAVPVYNHVQRGDLADRALVKARVEGIVEDGQPTQLSDGFRARQRGRRRIVKVTLLAPTTFDTGAASEPERYYETREVAATWEDYLNAKLERKQLQERAAQEREVAEDKMTRSKTRLKEMLGNYVPELADKVREPRHGYSTQHQAILTLTEEQVRDLINAALAKSKP